MNKVQKKGLVSFSEHGVMRLAFLGYLISLPHAAIISPHKALVATSANLIFIRHTSVNVRNDTNYILYHPQLKVFAVGNLEWNDLSLLPLHTVIEEFGIDKNLLLKLAEEGHDLSDKLLENPIIKVDDIDNVSFGELEPFNYFSNAWIRVERGDKTRAVVLRYEDVDVEIQKFKLKYVGLFEDNPLINFLGNFMAPLMVKVSLYHIISTLTEFRNDTSKERISEYIAKYDLENLVNELASEGWWGDVLKLSFLYHYASITDKPILYLCHYFPNECRETLKKSNKLETYDEVLYNAVKALATWYVVPLEVRGGKLTKAYLRNAYYPVEIVINKNGVEQFDAKDIFKDFFEQKVFLQDRSLIDLINDSIDANLLNELETALKSTPLYFTIEDLKVKRHEGVAILDADVSFSLNNLIELLDKYNTTIIEEIRRTFVNGDKLVEELLRYLDLSKNFKLSRVGYIVEKLKRCGKYCIVDYKDSLNIVVNSQWHSYFEGEKSLDAEELFEPEDDDQLNIDEVFEALLDVGFHDAEVDLRKAFLKDLIREGLV